MHAEFYNDIELQCSSVDKDQNELLQSIQSEKEKQHIVRQNNNLKLQKEIVEMKLLLKKKEISDQLRMKSEIARLKKKRKKLYISLKKEQNHKRILREKKIRAKKSHIIAHIDLSLQKMKVYQGNKLKHQWLVSTARKGYSTPIGRYKPQSLERMHYSKLYHHSPMPYTVFFSGNYAIHGTNSISRLGRKASHGCVRLHPKNAKVLYSMIQKSGKNNTEIKITY
jgi:hypothetical protein